MRGIARAGLAVAVLTAFAGCGDSRPSIDLQKGASVVLIGDSILFQSTEEVQASLKEAGLESFVSASPGAAIEGAPNINWHDALVQLVAAHHPDAVVIELGTNGCGYCRSLHDAVDDVMQAAKDVPDVLWIDARSDGIVPDDPDELNEGIRSAADRWENLTVVDFDELVDDDDIAADAIHLSDDGQLHFADSLRDVLT